MVKKIQKSLELCVQNYVVFFKCNLNLAMDMNSLT